MNFANGEVSRPGEDGRIPIYMNGPSLMVIGMEGPGEALYPYLPEDGKQLDVRIDGGMLYINGKLRAIDL
ncbi:MAG: hypothetical protein ACK2UW_16630, partial [Anaerolineales bacterium]